MIAWKDTFRHASHVMSNEKRDSYTQIASGERKSTGQEIFEFRRREYAMRKQREHDQRILDDFKSRRSPLVPDPNYGTQRQHGDIRLDAPYQGPSGISRDSIDLSSVVGARPPAPTESPNSVAGERFGKFIDYSGTSRSETIRSLESRLSRAVDAAVGLSSERSIHVSSPLQSGQMSRRNATDKKLDRIYSGIPSWLNYYIDTSTFIGVLDSLTVLANTFTRSLGSAGSNFKITTLNAINQGTGGVLTPALGRYGYMGSMQPFLYDATIPGGGGTTFIGFSDTTNRPTGLYRVSVSFLVACSVVSNLYVVLEEDEDGVALGAQSSQKTYAVRLYNSSVANVRFPFSSTFIWRYFGSSRGIRLIFSSSVAGNVLFSGPNVLVEKLDE